MQVQGDDDVQTGVDDLDPDLMGDGSDGDAGQERMVPLSALKGLAKTLRDTKTELARVSGNVEALKAQKNQPAPPAPAPSPKKLSRQDLRAAVDDGRISQDQMDATLETQLKDELTQTFEAKADAKVQGAKLSVRVETEISRYVEANPDINVAGSATRNKVQREFQKLVDDGAPENLVTELAAIKIVCGSEPKASQAGRRRTPESHVDGGGSGGGNDDNRGGGNDDWAKGLSVAQKQHYQKKIDQGTYKGYGDKNLKAEVDYIRKRAH